jgi:hypothetical protein
MGQYFKIVNLDKREYLAPDDFGVEMKLNLGWEELNQAFIYLLAQGFHPEHGWQHDSENKYLGRWAGDRVIVIGDYDESGLYGKLKSEKYKNISRDVMECFGIRMPGAFPHWNATHLPNPPLNFHLSEDEEEILTDPFLEEE